MIRQTLLVCGLARCGMTMTMQMLEAGGMQTFGEYPYEPEIFRPETDLAVHWPAFRDKAVKLLDPFRYRWPIERPLPAAVIWLDRDLEQQAKSQLKMLRMFEGAKIRQSAWRLMRSQFKTDTKASLNLLEPMGVAILGMRFEEILDRPLTSAKAIASFVHVELGISLDAAAMARVVIPRSASCAPDMSIEERLTAAAVGGLR